MTGRYALYFAPHPASLLWRLGCLWHGRDPATGATFSPSLPQGLTRQRYDAIVRSARHYGFHATLKPPFVLASGSTVAGLKVDVGALAHQARAFVAPALQVTRVGGFLALTLSGRCPAMDGLCAECVTQLDRHRAPAEASELAQRRKAGLTPRQEQLLVQWGYPYVMDEWQFHMTLTSSLVEPEITLLERHLQTLFRPVLAAPVFVDRIALFTQEARESPFTIDAWFPFGG